MISSIEQVGIVVSKYGKSIGDILSQESQYDIYELLGAIEVLVSAKIYKRQPTSAAERMVFALTWLGREVQNGGFHQYFFNSAGDFWKDGLIGLKMIADHEGALHFEKTLSIFRDSSPSEDRYTRQKQLEKLEEGDEDGVWEHFGKMTNLFFLKPFPRWDLVFGYVKGHANEFDFEGL